MKRRIGISNVNWWPHVGRWIFSAMISGDVGPPMVKGLLPGPQDHIRKKEVTVEMPFCYRK